MSGEIKDGGPAYPFMRETGFPNMPIVLGDSGITVRDLFALAALQGDWAAQNESSGSWSNSASIGILKERGELYYRMADAMLQTREVKP